MRKRNAENAAQIGAEGAQDAGLHHVQSPQQQGDAADEIEDHIAVIGGSGADQANSSQLRRDRAAFKKKLSPARDGTGRGR